MDDSGNRILVLAPLGRDAEMLASALRGTGFRPEICGDAAAVAAALEGGGGALLLAEEALTPAAVALLVDAVDRQPAWSDLPIVVLTSGGRATEPGTAVLDNLRRLGNVTFLERPVRVMTLLSTVAAALRARRRQYEVRNHLHERMRIEERLVAEGRAKDEFLAMLGHELRNPLAAIAAATHLLERTALPDDGSVPARRVIARQIRHLTRLVDDLLDVSRVTSGKIDLARKPLDAGVAVRNCVAALHASGALTRHRIAVETEPVWVNADDVRLDQIVNNLLVNAVKYTPADGEIRVRVRRDGDAAVIRVEDTGHGMDPELVSRVFDLFVQGRRGIERAQGGLGIGLTLVRRLVELHGGTVSAESEGAGRGSRFTIRLPAVSAPATAPTAPGRATPRAARRVLIVEDNDDARDMMAYMLKDAGHEVIEAADGPRGLDAALRERPDVAIVDVGLPVMDGYELARQVRATENGTRMVLIALTGYGLPEDRRRAHDAGFDCHLIKPVDFEALEAALALRA
ncbi:MAG: response regulator [Candidatus Rokubacteria bacterium]|nr:response regulator [Candidatus Rokubacteria bacterium]